MNNIFKLPRRQGDDAIDVSPLAFMPMWSIREQAHRHIDCTSSRQFLTQVFRIVARALVAGKVASNGNRTEHAGLNSYTARQRAVELLDLAEELDAHGRIAPYGDA